MGGSTTAKVLCLMGPTAIGKTALALQLAQHVDCEIISVDSGMVYRGCDIGTAKPTIAEQQQAPHHLIDICEPTTSYSAGQFRRDAVQKIQQVLQQGKLPILVGGTMLYFKVLQQGLADLPAATPQLKVAMQQRLQVEGLAALYAQLQQLDPCMAEKLAPTDTQRIQRALEVFILTGVPLSQLQRQSPAQPADWHFVNIGLLPPDRSWLQQRIAQRLHSMLTGGLLEEVGQLLTRLQMVEAPAQLPAMRLVGYRQIYQYLAGEINYATMVSDIGRATNQLAKRQLTWLRSWPQILTFDGASSNLLAKINVVFQATDSVI